MNAEYFYHGDTETRRKQKGFRLWAIDVVP